MEDLTKTVLINVETRIGDAKERLVELNETLTEQLTQKKLLELQNKRDTEAYQAVSSAVRQTKDAIRESNKELDNYSKALNANGNSIQQNRALLSALTSQYVKLSQETGKTSEGTLKMRDQISALSEKLKAQEKEIGLTSRSVGNYKDSIVNALSSLKNSIPGVQQFSGAAEAGGTALEGMGASAVAAGGIIAGLTAIVGGAVYYLSSLTTIGDKTSQVFEGIKSSFLKFAGAIASGNTKNLANDMREAYNAAADLKKVQQDLDRKSDVSEIRIKAIDNEIQKNMLALRYRKITLEEAKRIDSETEKLETERVQIKQENLRKEYAVLAEQSMASKKYEAGEQEQVRRQLYEGNLALVENLEKNDKIAKGTSEKMKAVMGEIIAANGEADQSMQKTANRMAIIEQRFAKNSQKVTDTSTKELAEANKGLAEVENAKLNSLARQAELTYSAYGKELAALDDKYRNMIFKEREFVANMEKGAKLAKNPEASARFLQAKEQGLKVIEQYKNEWSQALNKAIQDNNDKLLELTQKANNELQSATIANISNAETKEIETQELQQQIRQQGYEKERSDREKQISQLQIQSSTASEAEKQALTKQIDGLQSLQDLADKKEIAETQKTADEILKIRQKAASDVTELQDKINIQNAEKNGGDDNPFNKTLENAKIQKVKDDAQRKLQELGLDGDKNKDGTAFDQKQVLQKLEIQNSTENQITKIKEKGVSDRTKLELDYAQKAADAAFQIAQNSLQRQAQAELTYMELNKSRDLQNSSLTATQKQGIQERYRILEGQAKVKEFKKEQALALAKGAIDTAAAVIKAAPNPILMALAGVTGSLELGVIAAQKAPAFAKGGTFKSDGKGAVLPGYSKTDDTNAYLRSGEAVIVSEAVRNPQARSILSSINQQFGGRPLDGVSNNPWFVPGFATGGVFTPAIESGLRQNNIAQSRLNASDVNDLVNGITSGVTNGVAQAISTLPAPIVDVKDVLHQQAKYTNAQVRAEY